MKILLLILLMFISCNLSAQRIPKQKYYYSKDSIPPPRSCCITLTQQQFFETINKSGARIYIDTCRSNGNALIYEFTKRDSIIKLNYIKKH